MLAGDVLRIKPPNWLNELLNASVKCSTRVVRSWQCKFHTLMGATPRPDYPPPSFQVSSHSTTLPLEFSPPPTCGERMPTPGFRSTPYAFTGLVKGSQAPNL
jgi:hypothetical protein